MEDHPDHTFLDWSHGRRMSAGEAHSLERDLAKNPGDLPCRTKLIGYYGKRSYTNKTDQKIYFEHILYAIDHEPSLAPDKCITHVMGTSGATCTPKQFGEARAHWLSNVQRDLKNANVNGNAGMFISWRDFETGEELLKAARELDPTEITWPSRLTLFAFNEFQTSLHKYRPHYAERTIEYGKLTLSMGSPAPWMELEQMSECALFLDKFELATHCAIELANLDILPSFNHQTSNCLLGLIALKQNDVSTAVEYMLKKERGYTSLELLWRLARKLYDRGERDSIIKCIKQYKTKLKSDVRRRWIDQMQRGKPPDFEDWCC